MESAFVFNGREIICYKYILSDVCGGGVEWHNLKLILMWNCVLIQLVLFESLVQRIIAVKVSWHSGFARNFQLIKAQKLKRSFKQTKFSIYTQHMASRSHHPYIYKTREMLLLLKNIYLGIFHQLIFLSINSIFWTNIYHRVNL